MSLKHVDIQNAIRRLADKRIEDAMKEGKFDNLAGAGQPLDLEPIPAEENARMVWWAVRLLRRSGCSDLAVKWSRAADTTR
jgi:hypothetical protein